MAPAAQANATGAISGHVTTAGAVAACVLVLDARGQAVSTAATDSAGNYTAAGVPAGNWTVEFLPDNGCVSVDTPDAFQYYKGAATPGTATPVTVVSGQTTTGIDATLSAGATISGAVSSTDGQSLPGVCVVLQDSGGAAVVRQPTDEDGNYSIDQIPAGRFTMQFIDDGCVGRAARYESSYLGGAATLASATFLALRSGQVAGRQDAALVPLPTGAPGTGTGGGGTGGTGGSSGPLPVKPTGPGTTTVTPGAHAPARASVALLRAAGGRWTVDRRMRLHLRLRCAPHGPACHMTVTVSHVRRRGNRLVAGRSAGSRKLTLGAGRTRTVLVGLRGSHRGGLWIAIHTDGGAPLQTVLSVRWPPPPKRAAASQ